MGSPKPHGTQGSGQTGPGREPTPTQDHPARSAAREARPIALGGTDRPGGRGRPRLRPRAGPSSTGRTLRHLDRTQPCHHCPESGGRWRNRDARPGGQPDAPRCPRRWPPRPGHRTSSTHRGGPDDWRPGFAGRRRLRRPSISVRRLPATRRRIRRPAPPPAGFPARPRAPPTRRPLLAVRASDPLRALRQVESIRGRPRAGSTRRTPRSSGRQ